MTEEQSHKPYLFGEATPTPDEEVEISAVKFDPRRVEKLSTIDWHPALPSHDHAYVEEDPYARVDPVRPPPVATVAEFFGRERARNRPTPTQRLQDALDSLGEAAKQLRDAQQLVADALKHQPPKDKI